MDRSGFFATIGIVFTIIAFFGGMTILQSYPRSVTGQVTAISECYFPSDSTTIYIKTLNGSEYGLSIVAMGINLPIKIGLTYKISTGWFNSLVSITEIPTS